MANPLKWLKSKVENLLTVLLRPFCRHDWHEVKVWDEENDESYSVMEVCSKCGKERKL